MATHNLTSRPPSSANGSRLASTLLSTRWLVYLYSVVIVLVVALILYNAGIREPGFATTLGFLLAVLFVTLAGGRWPAIVATVATAVVFNYLFSPPSSGFNFPNGEDAELWAGLLIVAVGLGTATERMRRLREDASQLAASERLQKVLLSSISHDLKTPLTGVIGSLSTLLEEQALDQHARHELLTIAYRETKQLDQFVTEVLQMTQIEAGAVRIRQEPTDLRAIVQSAIDHLREILDGRRCRVTLPPGISPVSVDPVLFPHALINILDNAAKYSPPETPIEITARPGVGDVVISVEDRGIGIPAEHLDRVFEKFHRVKQPASPDGGITGAGLGLPIAKGIVDAHGGSIWAEQRDGGGTIVRIRLPLREDGP